MQHSSLRRTPLPYDQNIRWEPKGPSPSSVQSLCHVQLFATPWTTACQASLSITNSLSLVKSLYPVNAGWGRQGTPAPQQHLFAISPLSFGACISFPSFLLAVPLYKRHTFGSCPIVLGCSVLFFSSFPHLQSSFSLRFSLGSFYSRVLKFRDLS